LSNAFMRVELYCQSDFLGARCGYNEDMQRNSYVSRAALILLALALVVILPILAGGFWNLRDAESSSDPARASDLFELAARRLFWRDDLWEQAGLSASEAGQPEETIRLLLQSPAPSARGWLALGQAYLQTDQPDLALQAFESSLKLNASPQAYAGIAQIQYQRGNMEAERAALQNQLLLAPEDAAAQYRLGLLLSLLDINSALTHFQLAAQLDPEYDPVFETLRSTLNLAELSPTETGRLVILGRGLGGVSEWALAARAFESAVGADAGNAEAWAWLGEAKQHLGQDGRVELDQALALNPDSVVVRGLRGLYWKRLGDDRQALTEYQSAAALEPENPAWKASLGETYARLGDLVLALSNFQRATELAPEQSTYWRLLAIFCVENGAQIDDVGLPAAQKAADLTPEDPQALDTLGWAQLALGRFYTAEQTLLSALELSPNFAAARLHLAMVYLQTGDRNAAYDQLRQVLELDPNGAAGQQADLMLKQNFP
jgi:tetratricopeptide (TPR) repeat protein